jgi:FkbM family methyltransferase
MRTVFDKPYYLFQPRALARRLGVTLHVRKISLHVERRLPWGLPLRYRTDDEIGRTIERFGIYDLPVCELIWRLLDPGETAVDIGANIGHMTGLMALQAGTHGRVLAFEPHREIFTELAANVERWRRDTADLASIDLHRVAVTSVAGERVLRVGPEFATNRGTARLDNSVAGMTVRAETLDKFMGQADIGVLKVDVEGHELEVFKGSVNLLAQRRIRDIVFEDWADHPTPVTTFLREAGYAVLGVDQTLFGVHLQSPEFRPGRRAHSAPNYLATLDPQRALDRASQVGWGVFGLGPFKLATPRTRAVRHSQIPPSA